jgi:hypothetical protein
MVKRQDINSENRLQHKLAHVCGHTQINQGHIAYKKAPISLRSINLTEKKEGEKRLPILQLEDINKFSIHTQQNMLVKACLS